MSRRVLVTGSRTWTDEAAVRYALVEEWQAAEPGTLTVVHGACPSGADAQADKWCREMGRAVPGSVVVERHPADWWNYGNSAGFRRNAEMVAAGADVCLAFINGGSHGATHCADLAERAGIPVRRWTA